ncbi:unnamed protein product [Caenorhabditis bovis]|uniref:Uncharacterized protein n=1 Tax=Caenorhabditis bovis TaxID=2654633 RepID=A0A8S1FEU8_9PELO|nr:unnamed protein product [Caenorhabditis bovis]
MHDSDEIESCSTMRLIIVVALLVAVVVSQAQESDAYGNAGLADFIDGNRINNYGNTRLDSDGIPDKPEESLKRPDSGKSIARYKTILVRLQEVKFANSGLN